MKGVERDAAPPGTAGPEGEPGVAIRNCSPLVYPLRYGFGAFRFPHADRVPGTICGNWGNAGMAEVNHMQYSMYRA
jgi:hypothetical protein